MNIIYALVVFQLIIPNGTTTYEVQGRFNEPTECVRQATVMDRNLRASVWNDTMHMWAECRQMTLPGWEPLR